MSNYRYNFQNFSDAETVEPKSFHGKAHMHETLQEMSLEITRRSKAKSDVVLDSYIVSVTPYEALCAHYENGSWNKDEV